ncbi:MAG TPA: allophanate hydrolase subunit 1 [Pusillimonas sp.]|jgi:KipI family sensor histidine kinase inhibitor|nr:allophanate hydrolase subunit 1 [Pusillimonas sp.]HCN73554.1 allophanate hydrolase subunit 1 [Pusillimonas sp.]|tara:strand:- start:37341 stop:38063 length:723 start_codon:yes stop_codon:yes gene_type:complete
MTVQFLSAGDTAMVVQFGQVIDRVLSDQVLALSRRIRALSIPGVVDLVPTFRSLLINYDPTQVRGADLQATLEGLLESGDTEAQAVRQWSVPVCYDGEYAPDLQEVAQTAGLSADEVVQLHTDTQFHVYMIGFVPGYPYMGDLPKSLVLPRRSNPRTRVPPGSVAIASTMTAVYPIESPGGWHLIGATPIRLFDTRLEAPALFKPGDKVRFKPVAAAEYQRIREAVQADEYEVQCEKVMV